jgi:hypothetical protein
MEDIGAAGCRAPFGTQCFDSFTSGSVKLSFPLFAKVWALSASPLVGSLFVLLMVLAVVK